MPRIADFTHLYRGPRRELAGWRIRLYRLASGLTVVVASELPGNVPRDRRAALVEALAAEIRRLYVASDATMRWIEHERGERETFDQVLFQWDGHASAEPERRPLSREQVEALIGEVLGDREG
jgi:hypothetical protein